MLTTLVALAASTGSMPIALEPIGDRWIVRAADASQTSIDVMIDSDDRSLPPLLGTRTSEGRDLLFMPRFPFQPGVRYRAVVPGRPAFSFEIPALQRQHAQPRVTGVYPSAAVLPENLLKFYIEFATPMTRGEAYRRIRLLDEREREVELPFLVLDEELWDARLQRFTLYFDPGRVKSELVPNREVGSPLRAGQRYTLIVDAGWKDAHGIAIATPFRKPFTVGARDETSPDPQRWQIRAPLAGSSDALTIQLPDPLEHALALRMIDVRDAANASIQGETRLVQDETRWSFTPAQPWQAGRYSLVIDAALEDLAGNKVSRPFEVAIRSDAERKAAPGFVTLPVEIRTPK